MATTAVDRMFVDTNVLVYSTVASAPPHALALQRLVALRQAGVELWISRPVLREYIATLTRPQTYSRPVPAAVVAADVAYFQTVLHIAEDGPAVTANLLHLLTTVPVAGRQVHDANIVATMLAHGVPKLLTHNTADFARFAAVITVVPLVP
jgi:predicted nucleic acid-binding protein